MSDTTPRLILPLVGDTSQKRIVMNEGLMRLESLVQAQVKSRTTAAQPASPADGDAYILPVAPIGADWSARTAGSFLRSESTTWEPVIFPDGAIVHIADENRFVIRSGGAWAAFEDAIPSLDNLTHVGIATTGDSSNVLALKGPAALLSAQYAAYGGSGDISLTVNKEADGGTAQILLQRDFSTRAILGLLADNNLTCKLSPDGAAFTTAFSLDAATGQAIWQGGSAAAPVLGIGSGDTGLYRVDSTTLGFSLSGVLRYSFGAGGTTFAATGAISMTYGFDGESGVNLRATRYSADANGPNLTQRKARGSTAAPAVVGNGDACGLNQGSAYSGSAFVAIGSHQFAVAETTPSATAMGALWKLSLTPAGTVTQGEILRVEHASGLSLFGANPVIDKNRNHRLRIYTVATLPAAGTASGQFAMVSDAGSPALAATVTGGGSTCVPVYSDGVNWRAG